VGTGEAAKATADVGNAYAHVGQLLACERRVELGPIHNRRGKRTAIEMLAIKKVNSSNFFFKNRVLEDVMIGERIGVRSQAVSVPLSLLSYFRRSLHVPVFCTASIDVILSN